MTFRAAVPGASSGKMQGWRRRDTMSAAAVGSLAALLAPSVWAQPVSALADEAKAPPLPELGSALEVPRITRFDGSVYEPAQSQGQVLLVYWWSSTCPFCALQSPHMDKLWRSQQARGLQMLALSIDRKPEDATAYLRSRGYSFPSAWASPEWRKAFPKPRGLPITLVHGRDGKVVLAERSDQVQHALGRAADAHAPVIHCDGALQQDRVGQHSVDQLVCVHVGAPEVQDLVGHLLAAQELAHRQSAGGHQTLERGPVGWGLEVFDDDGFDAALTQQRQGLARGTATSPRI